MVFYYSGHGVPDGVGNTYLSSSEITVDDPYSNGFSFADLTLMMSQSISTRIVSILDCCYSGSLKIEEASFITAEKKKSAEQAIAKKANESISETIDNKSHQLMNEGKYILASSQAYQESIMLKKLEHSLFTYYLLEGLEGAEGKSVDSNGNVTPITLGDYIYEQIMTLPPEGRPVQKPILKTENSGQVILAAYPSLRSLWQPVSMQNWKFITPTDFREVCQIILEDMGFKNIHHLDNPSEWGGYITCETTAKLSAINDLVIVFKDQIDKAGNGMTIGWEWK